MDRVLFLVLLSTCVCQWSCAEYLHKFDYYRDYQDLTEVPDDISDDVKGISLSHNQIEEIPFDTFLHFSELKELYLDDNQISRIQPGMFPSSLTFLTLWGNNITNLPDAVFQNLVNLETLEIGYNDLREVRLDMWKGLKSLEKLSLTRNRNFHALADGVFESLNNLRYLFLDGINIKEVRVEMWDGLESLLSLDLGHNPVTQITSDSFQSLGKLTKLELTGCELEEIHGGIWAGLGSLETVPLDKNNIKTLRDGAFRPLKNLTLLFLVQNDIEVIRGEMWEGLDALRNLYLDQNNLGKITEEMFTGLDSLKSLSLEDCSITTLDEGAFTSLPKLRRLNLNKNPLDTLKEEAFGLNNAVSSFGRAISAQVKTCDFRLCWLMDTDNKGFEHRYVTCGNYEGTYIDRINLSCD